MRFAIYSSLSLSRIFSIPINRENSLYCRDKGISGESASHFITIILRILQNQQYKNNRKEHDIMSMLRNLIKLLMSSTSILLSNSVGTSNYVALHSVCASKRLIVSPLSRYPGIIVR